MCQKFPFLPTEMEWRRATGNGTGSIPPHILAHTHEHTVHVYSIGYWVDSKSPFDIPEDSILPSFLLESE